MTDPADDPWAKYSSPPLVQGGGNGDASTAPANQPPLENGTENPENSVWSGIFRPKWLDVPRDASPGIKALGIAANAIPSIVNAHREALQPFLHPLDTADALKQIGVGLYSKEQGWVGAQQDPQQKEKDEAAINAVLASYGDKYGSVEGFTHALANDPASVMLDVSTVFSGGAAGAGKAAGLLGRASRAGRAAQTASRAMGTAATVTNPLAPAMKATGALAGAGAKAVSDVPGLGFLNPSSAILDRTGQFTPEVQSLIHETYGGRLNPDHLTDVKPQIAEVLSQKGINAAALNEAIMKSADMIPTTSAVSGVRPVEAAADIVSSANAANAGTAQNRAKTIVGASPVSQTALADALSEARAQAKVGVNQAYTTLENTPGEFHPQVGASSVDAIHQAIKNAGLPSLNPLDYRTGEIPGSIAKQYPESIKAIDNVAKDLAAGETPNIGPLSMKNMNDVRKGLNISWQNSGSGDTLGINAIKKGFDQNMADALAATKSGTAQLFSGDPAAATGVLETANAAHAQYRSLFHNTDDIASSVVAKSVKQLADNVSPIKNGVVDPVAAQGINNVAQSILQAGLDNPKVSAALYDKLAGTEKTTGIFSTSPDNANILRQMIRNSVVNVENPAQLPKSINDFLGNQHFLADRVFSPGEQAELRRIAEAARLATSKTTTASAQSSGMNKAVSIMTKIGLGAAGGWYYNGIVGAAAGVAAQHVLEKIGQSFTRHSQLAGAPTVKTIPPFMSNVENATRAATQGSAMLGQNESWGQDVQDPWAAYTTQPPSQQSPDDRAPG